MRATFLESKDKKSPKMCQSLRKNEAHLSVLVHFQCWSCEIMFAMFACMTPLEFLLHTEFLSCNLRVAASFSISNSTPFSYSISVAISHLQAFVKMSSLEHHHEEEEDIPEDEILNPEDAEEEIPQDDDHPMENDEAEEEIQFQNDSAAHFDTHTDSVFCIAQHPLHPSIVATGGGDDIAYIFDASLSDGPVLPSSYESNPEPKGEREGLKVIQKLDGHTDSVNAVAFTQPSGEYVVTAGLDGKLRAWRGDKTAYKWAFVAEVQEVQEINWVSVSPHPQHPNTIALGANDGSVWVYQINAQDKESPLNIL